MTLTRTTCPYCGVGCGVLAAADGTIKGDPDHPANFGRLCSKGAALGETIDLDGRLLHPQINGVRANWDTALDMVAQRFSDAIAQHGPESVAFYASGQMLIEDYYVANKLMKGFIGAANIDTNSRLCMASSVAGHKRAFGTDTVPGTYEDLEQADLVVLVGSNLAWCHPVLHQRIAAAKQARPHMRIVNVDPRRTATTDLADVHLRIAPVGDVALFNGLLAYLAETGKLDKAYTENHVNGLDAALAAAQASDPADSGLNARELADFYALWANTPKVVTARRSIGDMEHSVRVETPNYDYRYLCTELRQKRMGPGLTTIRAKSVEQFGEYVRHAGEEYVYVVKGSIVVHTEFYDPVTLCEGQSIYIDASMGHAYVTADDCAEAVVLGVMSSPDDELMQELLKIHNDQVNANKNSPVGGRKKP